MHSHHSHSGDYILHARDTLEEIVDEAEKQGFTHFCLTEHMPRLDNQYLYPEEKEKNYDWKNLDRDFKNYLEHAEKLQKKYNSKNGMKILLGFELEGVDERHIEWGKKLMDSPLVNMCVGSVHYVNGIPIDYSPELWEMARDSTEFQDVKSLYKEYFELQYEVITRVKPTVVGHFDLIRLMEPDSELDPVNVRKMKYLNMERDWPDIWRLVVRNIKAVAEYGGLFELNSSAIRKGWHTPYPRQDISEAIKRYGNSRFCLSDDSHAVSQVGLNYKYVWEYITEVLELEQLYYLDLDDNSNTVIKEIYIEDAAKCRFWKKFNI